MTRVDHFKTAYADLKKTLIGEIRDIVRHQDDQILDLFETQRTPALVTMVVDDQESETINCLYINGNDTMVSAGIFDDDTQYNLEEFEVPFLIEILNSAIVHTEDI